MADGLPRDEERPFLARWSERKQASRQDMDLPEPAPAAAVEAAELPARLDEAAEEPPAPLTDADLPDPETLDASADFSGYLSEGISEQLRQRALRHLFHLPQFHVLDGLNDYDLDYTSYEPLGDLMTADLRYRLEVEARRQRAAAAEPPAEEPVNEVPADGSSAAQSAEPPSDGEMKHEREPEPEPKPKPEPEAEPLESGQQE